MNFQKLKTFLKGSKSRSNTSESCSPTYLVTSNQFIGYENQYPSSCFQVPEHNNCSSSLRPRPSRSEDPLSIDACFEKMTNNNNSPGKTREVLRTSAIPERKKLPSICEEDQEEPDDWDWPMPDTIKDRLQEMTENQREMFDSMIKVFARKLYMEFEDWRRSMEDDLELASTDLSLVHSKQDEQTARSILEELHKHGIKGKSICDAKVGEDVLYFLTKLHQNTDLVFVLVSHSFKYTQGLHQLFTEESLISPKKVIPIEFSSQSRVLKEGDILRSIVPLFLDSNNLAQQIKKLLKRPHFEPNLSCESTREKILEMEVTVLEEIRLRMESLLNTPVGDYQRLIDDLQNDSHLECLKVEEEDIFKIDM